MKKKYFLIIGAFLMLLIGSSFVAKNYLNNKQESHYLNETEQKIKDVYIAEINSIDKILDFKYPYILYTNNSSEIVRYNSITKKQTKYPKDKLLDNIDQVVISSSGKIIISNRPAEFQLELWTNSPTSNKIKKLDFDFNNQVIIKSTSNGIRILYLDQNKIIVNSVSNQEILKLGEIVYDGKILTKNDEDNLYTIILDNDESKINQYNINDLKLIDTITIGKLKFTELLIDKIIAIADSKSVKFYKDKSLNKKISEIQFKDYFKEDFETVDFINFHKLNNHIYIEFESDKKRILSKVSHDIKDFIIISDSSNSIFDFDKEYIYLLHPNLTIKSYNYEK